MFKTIFIMVVLIFTLSACADKYILPDLPQPSEAPQYYQPIIEDSYRIQIADRLLIQSYYDSQLNQSLVVRPDGRISLILIGEIDAVNKKPAMLAEEIKKAYDEHLDAPDINVVVSEVAPRRMYIGGEVNSPSVHVIENSLTLMQSITLSRGFEDTANTNQVILLRQSDDGLVIHQIDTDKILKNEIPDVFMAQNDVVFVPRTNIANINLFVDQYMSKMVPDFIRVNFGFNYQIGNISTDSVQETILTAP